MKSYRCGYVAVVGLPNAGKSTLVNRMVGEKVSIVSPKTQTTRQNVTGLLTDEDSQIIFVDAPGFIRSESGLNHFIQQQWENSLKESDCILAVFSLDTDTEEQIDQALETLKSANKPIFVFISKTDLTRFAERLFIIEHKLRTEKIPYLFGNLRSKKPSVFESLKIELKKRLPESDNYLFDADLFTLQTERQWTSEIIREKCFLNLSEEIPYQLAVNVFLFKDDPRCKKIFADLWISKERYKKIVVGHKGQKIHRIGTESRKALENLLGQKVYLNLNVKYKDSWNKNSSMMKELGYGFKKDH